MRSGDPSPHFRERKDETGLAYEENDPVENRSVDGGVHILLETAWLSDYLFPLPIWSPFLGVTYEDLGIHWPEFNPLTGHLVFVWIFFGAPVADRSLAILTKNRE